MDRTPAATVYVPVPQVSDGFNALLVQGEPIAWVVRTLPEPHSLSGAARDELIRASGGLPLASIRSMDEIVGGATARQEFNMFVLTGFGFAALILAAIGIYGLVAYSIEQRTREIGIRLAVGAGPADVKKMIVGEGMRLVAMGTSIGIVAAIALRRVLTSMLFGVKAGEPMVFAAAACILGLVACLSIWLAARRLSRIEPASALRCE